MWFCFNNGFVSAVENRDDKDGLVVRARRREHLVDNFPNKNIVVGGSTDYKYRIFIGKKEFAEIIKDRIMDIDYGNFKNSVEDDDLHDLYSQFWRLHYRFQN
jgi:hypothetical protein